MPKPTSAAAVTGRRVLYWFRTDLRLHDSPALTAALNLEGIEAFYPIWCFDPQYVWRHKVGVNRWQFLLESMQDTSSALTKLNPQQKMHVIRGSPEDVLPLAWKSWGITDMVFEKDTAAYALQRDKSIQALAAELAPSLKIHIVSGHNLLDPEDVVKKGNGGKCISTLMQWQKASAKVGPIPRPISAPTYIPNPGPLDLDKDMLEALKDRQEEASEASGSAKPGTLAGIAAEMKPEIGGSGSKANKEAGRGGKANGKGKGKAKAEVERPIARLRGPNMNGDIMDGEVFDCFDYIDGPEHDFAVPTMDSLGLSTASTSIHGGETEALSRLKAFLSVHSQVATFSKPATAPTSLEPSTTQLSPFLKFGCLSVREFYWRAKDISDGYKPKKGEKVTKEPENLMGQLEFRDMYYCAEVATPHFCRIHGNPLSRFINWGLKNHVDEKGELVLPRPRGKDVDEERFSRWKEGQTGFPWIDAVMRQLKSEGWIHHLARHSVACFLTRGQCYISWERGAEVFDEWLLDWDPCSNPGNWMWLSCSAFFHQYYRVYGLTSWPKKTDTQGLLVRKYCPELAGVPDKYIYEPHLAPLNVQKKANCIIGVDYPAPMLNEQTEKTRCIERLKIAFELGIHGDNKAVMNGQAEAMLRQAFRDKMGREEDDGEKGELMGKEGAAGAGTAVGGKKRKIADADPVSSGPMDQFVKKPKH